VKQTVELVDQRESFKSALFDQVKEGRDGYKG
jgi:hypothetical protein